MCKFINFNNNYDYFKLYFLKSIRNKILVPYLIEQYLLLVVYTWSDTNNYGRSGIQPVWVNTVNRKHFFDLTVTTLSLLFSLLN